MTPRIIELCKDLFKKWAKLDNSNFSAETISGGITNLYFTVDGGADLPDEDDARRMHRRSLLPREDDQEDVEALERSIRARYARSSHTEYDEETTDVEQRALLPSVRDPTSAVALDHLKNYIYIEVDKEAHVREACQGMRSLFSNKNEDWDIQRGPCKIVDVVDIVRQRVTVKLIPRIDLQALANKLVGREFHRRRHLYLLHVL
ncbi:hypothetical protein F0562_006928 [Nyssa sinensis]|uniref:Uncharacterized protein n=1 Tax=Nyssa sinensis TaxID=561372 RepID=A0A5J5A5I3_9ASTE|nr:hypothetical protein F0562_006928 [Nyssa sinensis]